MIQQYVREIENRGIKPEVILEIGSRDGNDINFIKEYFNIQNSNVYIVEPNPIMSNEIKDRYPNYNTLECAINNVSGTMKFNQVTNTGYDRIGTSSLLNRVDGWYEHFETNQIDVNVITGRDLMGMINKPIDLCKIDVEGLTYEVIESFGESINNIKSFHLETEHRIFWENQKLHSDVCNLLGSLGYTLIWENNDGIQSDTIWLKNELTMSFKDIEIHTLICKRDILLAINNIKSFQKFEEFSQMPIILHDDGSLDDEDINLLSDIKNIEIIRRDYADREIEKFIKDYPNCMSYRLGGSHINLWHKIKTFDYFFFSKTKRIIGMDTDLLFIRKPQNVIDLINTNTPFYFPDCQSSYCFNEPKSEVPVPERVNTGLIFIPSEDYYNINHLEFALSNLIRGGINYFPSWIEQSAYAHMFHMDGRYVSLDDNKYKIPYFQQVDISLIECLHFVSYPAVRDTYPTYLDYLNISQGELVYLKQFKVDFKDVQIPLGVKMYKFEKFLNVEFYWGLEETSQDFLDHIFYIRFGEKEMEHKFQSNKNSFFIVPLIDSKFEMWHTYEWYGDVDVKQLDIISL